MIKGLRECVAVIFRLPVWMLPAFEDIKAVEEWAWNVFARRLVSLPGHQIAILPRLYLAETSGGVVLYTRGMMAYDEHPGPHSVQNVMRTWHFEESVGCKVDRSPRRNSLPSAAGDVGAPADEAWGESSAATN